MQSEVSINTTYLCYQFNDALYVIFAFIWFSFHRLWQVGDYRGYYLGDTRPITRTSLFPVLSISMPVALGALVAVLHMLRGRFPETADAAD